MMSVLMLMILMLMFPIMRIEKSWREETLKVAVAAYFIYPDSRTKDMTSYEIILGTGKKADLRIAYPGLKKNEQKKKLRGIDTMHALVEKKRNKFFIKNISRKYPVEIKHGQYEYRLLPNMECELPHDCEVRLGSYTMRFKKGVL